MNTPVSFPIAKLAIQKGFDKECKEYWNLIEYSTEWIVEHRINPDSVDFMYAPTIAEVVMWLYEKHNLFVGVYWCNMGANEYSYKIVDLYNEEEIKDSFFGAGSSYTGTFNSPTEAYEAAILYVLNNLAIFANK